MPYGSESKTTEGSSVRFPVATAVRGPREPRRAHPREIDERYTTNDQLSTQRFRAGTARVFSVALSN
jgi:hypothetical protein